MRGNAPDWSAAAISLSAAVPSLSDGDGARPVSRNSKRPSRRRLAVRQRERRQPER